MKTSPPSPTVISAEPVWVYADAVRTAETCEDLQALSQRLAQLEAPGPSIERHARVAALFIAASSLAQGLADAAMTEAGGDTPTEEQAAAMALVMAVARSLLASWEKLSSPPSATEACLGLHSPGTEGWSGLNTHLGHGCPAPSPGVESEVETALRRLAEVSLPVSILLKSAEGYAFYALYPEAYAAAARALSADADATIIGIRSIGLGLAAIVAVALGAAAPFSVRPVGPPFQRRLALTLKLQQALQARRNGWFVVVDEGPGLSGSSFGAVADALEVLGVPRERISFLPGHGGELGPEASAPHRARWAAAERPYVSFDALALRPERPGWRLESWFEDLCAGGGWRLRDLSGGAWRALRYGEESAWPAVNTFQERRKLRLETEHGCWLLKFVGLGAAGERAFDHARRLGEAGFTSSPVALRYGFMAEPWRSDTGPLRLPPDQRRAFIAHLGRYLSWRAVHLPAPPGSGAELQTLLEMARVNACEALGDRALKARALDHGLWAEAPPIRRVWTDNRLHGQEWLQLGESGWLKTDAVDHAAAHDLIGAQDIAWDVAGAGVEFDLDDAEMALLLEALGDQAELRAGLQPLMETAYLAFQLGAYTLAERAHAGHPREQVRLAAAAQAYRARLERRLWPS